MPDDASPNSRLVAKIDSLQPEQVAQVEAFLNKMTADDPDRALRIGALVGSEAAFAAVWDNDDDAIYDEL